MTEKPKSNLIDKYNRKFDPEEYQPKYKLKHEIEYVIKDDEGDEYYKIGSIGTMSPP